MHKPWAVQGAAATRKNLINSIYLESDELEAHQHALEAKYARAKEREPRHELYLADGADVLLVGFGIVSRVPRTVAEAARKEGMKVGVFRPITLWPFPERALQEATADVDRVMVVELSNGQMVEDVRLALNGEVPIEFYSRVGGNVPSVEEVQKVLAARPALTA